MDARQSQPVHGSCQSYCRDLTRITEEHSTVIETDAMKFQRCTIAVYDAAILRNKHARCDTVYWRTQGIAGMRGE